MSGNVCDSESCIACSAPTANESVEKCLRYLFKYKSILNVHFLIFQVYYITVLVLFICISFTKSAPDRSYNNDHRVQRSADVDEMGKPELFYRRARDDKQPEEHKDKDKNDNKNPSRPMSFEHWTSIIQNAVGNNQIADKVISELMKGRNFY